jgi:CelD/BcsL family acetyltransferase involved in cellulose biosynthesis
MNPEAIATTLPTRHTQAPARQQDGPITVELVRSCTLAPSDAAALVELVAQRPNVGLFLSRPWLTTYFTEPPGKFEPHLALFRQGTELRGIAPVGIGDRSRLTLLGGGAASDRTDLLAARGFESRCADALFEWLNTSFGENGFVLELRDVPHDSAIWAAMHRLDGDRLVALAPREVHAGPYLDLHEFRSESIGRLQSVASLSESLERHRRKLERGGHLRLEVLRETSEALAAFDTLVRFLHQRWLGHPDGSATDDPWKQRFHRRLIPLLLEDGYLRMVRVSIDLRTVAVLYCIVAGKWWGCYLVGYDRASAGKIHLGRVALSLGMTLGIQEGATEFDFLKGAEPVKYLWPVRERITIDADVFAGRASAQLTRAARAARDVGVGLAHSVRHLLTR